MAKLEVVSRMAEIDGELKEVNIHKVTKRKNFRSEGVLENKLVKKVFDFAFDMSFGEKGKHRPTRSGGKENRWKGQIFANAFQGKLAEFAVQEHFKKEKIFLNDPDIDVYGQGNWDSYDFIYSNGPKEYKISIKSTKAYGQLLLLETKDWNQSGEYLPNKKRGDRDYLYDFFILVRIKPSIENIMKDERFLYCDRLITNDKLTKEEIIIEEKILLEKLFGIAEDEDDFQYEYDIPGVISIDTLRYIIKENYILPKDEFLGSIGTPMDAENYYIQVGDFKDINQLIDKIKA